MDEDGAAGKPPVAPNTRRHRRNNSSAQFFVGAKVSLGRFVNQCQGQFVILGFHDEERFDHVVMDEFVHHSQASFSRNTLSPVREEQAVRS
jgi:hypothetical protein